MAARLTTFVVVGIVAATLIAGFIVGAQRDDSDGPIDLIIHNGDGLFGGCRRHHGRSHRRARQPDRARRAAIATSCASAVAQTEVIDANHAAVVPGFNDAHVHLIGGGLALDNIDLLDAETVEDIETPNPEMGCGQSRSSVGARTRLVLPAFAGGLPTRQMLDALVAIVRRSS